MPIAVNIILNQKTSIILTASISFLALLHVVLLQKISVPHQRGISWLNTHPPCINCSSVGFWDSPTPIRISECHLEWVGMLSGTTHFHALHFKWWSQTLLYVSPAKALKSLKMWFLKNLYVNTTCDRLYFEFFEENDCMYM